jgi:hypothetical protein
MNHREDLLEKVDEQAPKKLVTISINESLWRESKQQIWREGWNFSDMVEELLRTYLITIAMTPEELKENGMNDNGWTDEQLESSDTPVNPES